MSGATATVPTVVVVESDLTRQRALVEVLGPGTLAVGSVEEAAHHLDNGGALPPVVVVSGPSQCPAAAVALTMCAAGRVVVAVYGRGSTAELRDAMDAGVGDLVGADATPAQLRHAVRRAGLAAMVASQPLGEVSRDQAGLGVAPAVGPARDRDAKAGCVAVSDPTVESSLPVGSAPERGLVAVLAPKGGTGGTTVAVNLALALAAGAPHGPNAPLVASIVDADLQFGDAALVCGVDPRLSMASLSGAVNALAAMPDATAVGRTLTRLPGSAAALLAAPLDPALSERVTASLVGRVLDVLVAASAWVVVDLPSLVDDRAMEVIDRATRVIVVATAEPLGMKDARAAGDLLDRLGVGPRWSLVCNAPQVASGLGEGALEAHVGRRVVVSVPHDPAVGAAVLRGCPVVLDAPYAPAARAVAALAGSLRAQPVPSLPDPSPLRSAVDRLIDGARRAWSSQA